ncbi:MAG: helix-turn-helix domain-containing protein [Acidimicrobiales bacterium]
MAELSLDSWGGETLTTMVAAFVAGSTRSNNQWRLKHARYRRPRYPCQSGAAMSWALCRAYTHESKTVMILSTRRCGMAAVELRQETYLPEAGEKELASVHDFLRAHESAGKGQVTPRYLLIGTEIGEQVELPAEVYRVLHQVVEAMSSGMAVTVAPRSQSMTTQQAAELLGVSRPTLVRLLDEGRIPYERIGSHRRLILRDVLDYRERRREEQYRALNATSMGIDEEVDIERTLASLREARKKIAAKRRSR